MCQDLVLYSQKLKHLFPGQDWVLCETPFSQRKGLGVASHCGVVLVV